MGLGRGGEFRQPKGTSEHQLTHIQIFNLLAQYGEMHKTLKKTTRKTGINHAKMMTEVYPHFYRIVLSCK